MSGIRDTPMIDTIRQLGGGVDLGKLISKDNFPKAVEDIWWSIASKVNAFGNLTPAEVQNVWAQVDNFQMEEMKWMNEEELAEYDESYWDQIRLVTQSIVSLARDGTLLKASMSEGNNNNGEEGKSGPGMFEKLGRFGGGDPNEPTMISKMERWK